MKHLASGVFVIGILAQSGGFFVHMAKGEEGVRSIGTTIRTLGAVILTVALAILVYGLATAP